MRNAMVGWLQAGIKTGRRNINSLRYADDTTLMAESKAELKRLLMRVKEKSERAGLKLNIKNTKIMASSPITSWQIEGEMVEAVTDILFLGSKITVEGDCNHEIRRRLLLGRKAMANLDRRGWKEDTLLCPQRSAVKAVVFPVVTIGCESWIIKKAEHKELMPTNCGGGEDSWTLLGQKGVQTSQS